MKNTSKVLLVEDDASISRIYEKVFKFEGYKVTLAINGKEALEKLEEELPDIIVLDLMMPVMSGIEFLERVKKNPATKNVPVVILTNLAGENDAKLGLSKGAIKYMIKSNQDPQEVAKVVTEILSGAVPAQASAVVEDLTAESPAPTPDSITTE